MKLSKNKLMKSILINKTLICIFLGIATLSSSQAVAKTKYLEFIGYERQYNRLGDLNRVIRSPFRVSYNTQTKSFSINFKTNTYRFVENKGKLTLFIKTPVDRKERQILNKKSIFKGSFVYKKKSSPEFSTDWNRGLFLLKFTFERERKKSKNEQVLKISKAKDRFQLRLFTKRYNLNDPKIKSTEFTHAEELL